MPSSTLTSKSQITVPKVVREPLALHPGDRIRFVIHADRTVTVEAETVDLRSLKGIIKATRHATLEDMENAIAEGAIHSAIGTC